MADNEFDQIRYFWIMKQEFIVNAGENSYQIELDSENQCKGKINGENFDLDILRTKSGFSVIKNKTNYSVEVVSFDRVEKKVELKINHKFYSFIVKDKFDTLLEKLGMDVHAAGKVSEIKAPMPGLVIDVMVNAGDEIKVDQPLIILEAMKMENVIKSPSDNSIKKVSINKGDSVEKNQVLIEFN